MTDATSDRDRTQADRDDRAERLERAANPPGDFPAPDAGVTRLPEETAEEGSVAEANDSIRDVLRQQSGRTDGDDGGGQQQAAEPEREPEPEATPAAAEPEPEPEPAPAAEPEPAPAPKRGARHADD
jgi:hypothetical protein